MLYTFVAVFLLAWLLGVLGVYSIGGYAYVPLAIAMVLIVVKMLSGRRGLA